MPIQIRLSESTSLLVARCARICTSAPSRNHYQLYILRYSKAALKVRPCSVIRDVLRDTYISQTLPRPSQENPVPVSSYASESKYKTKVYRSSIPPRTYQYHQMTSSHQKPRRKHIQMRFERRRVSTSRTSSKMYLRCTRFHDLSAPSSVAKALCLQKMVILSRHGNLSSIISRYFASSRTSSQKYVLHITTTRCLYDILGTSVRQDGHEHPVVTCEGVFLNSFDRYHSGADRACWLQRSFRNRWSETQTF